MIRAQPGVHSSAMIVYRELAQGPVYALKRHSCADSNEKKTGFTLIKEVSSICEQLKFTAVNASQLFHYTASLL